MAVNLASMILAVLAVGSIGILAFKKWKRPGDCSTNHCEICSARRLRLLPDLIVNPELALPRADLPGSPILN